jgi:Tol biopolymer transport system component
VRLFKNILSLIIILIFFWTSLPAQFYNGHQFNFGKNRVQYNDFYWEYYRFQRYDTYFYLDGKKLARYTSKVIDEELKKLEDFFSHSLDQRIIFIIYNKQSEFKQSNIGLVSGNETSNIGGTARIISNKVFIYYEGDHQKFVKQIRAALAEIILTDLMYGGSLKQKVGSSALLSIPDWYFKGLISYLAENWSIDMDNKVKDAIENGKLQKFSHLTDKDAVIAGHAIWNYIAHTYGSSVIPNILYLARVNKSIESGFLFVLGTDIKTMTPMWIDFYSSRYKKDNVSATMPQASTYKIKSRKNRVYQFIEPSPGNKFVAYTTNYMGKHHIWIYNTQTGKRKKVIRLEQRLQQITDYSYPIIAWHPTGKILAWVAEEHGKLLMHFYFVETGKEQVRALPYYDKILDFSYSDNGLDMVFSAVMKGQTDLFIYNLSSGSSEQITNDVDDEINPRFVDNSRKIIFASNRLNDTIFEDKNFKPEVSPTYDLFLYDRETKSKVLKRITDSKVDNESSPEGIKENSYTFLSDKNGVLNRYLATSDSTISFVDTITHYRYYTVQYPITNYKRNIEYYDLNKDKKSLVEILFNNRRDRIFNSEFDMSDKSGNDFKNTVYRKERTKEFAKKDSLLGIEKQKIIRQKEIRDSLASHHLILHPDSVPIDINYYVFESEKENPYHIVYGTDSTLETKQDTVQWPEQKIYLTSFYPDELVSQIDFSWLNDMYQSYNFGAYYFNPGMNVLTKIGISDLFEDYKLVGAFRIGVDFQSFEFLLSLEDLKNRWDKQYILHRTSEISWYDSYIGYKIISNEAKFKLSYPFDQVSSFRATATLRTDRAIFLSTYNATLAENDQYRYLAGAKFEYIFDNTIDRGINLYNGVRFKAFAEYYQNIEKGGFNTYVFGADLRFYVPLHRSMIFAGRIASSASYGSGKLIYYLGGVDNWINFSTKIPTFDQTVNIDPNENYAFQAVATDMRGFVQNSRNGTKFCIANAEIRLPLFRYLINRPLSRDFLDNFQVVGFADMGSAWSGFSPWEKNNAYNTEIVGGETQTGTNPVRVIIDKKRSPIIMGYGFGLRSKLLGYFIRTDWAWGIDGNVILPRVFYFSLSLDF